MSLRVIINHVKYMLFCSRVAEKHIRMAIAFVATRVVRMVFVSLTRVFSVSSKIEVQWSIYKS
jgi:hypothetical protein